MGQRESGSVSISVVCLLSLSLSLSLSVCLSLSLSCQSNAVGSSLAEERDNVAHVSTQAFKHESRAPYSHGLNIYNFDH